LYLEFGTTGHAEVGGAGESSTTGATLDLSGFLSIFVLKDKPVGLAVLDATPLEHQATIIPPPIMHLVFELSVHEVDGGYVLLRGFLELPPPDAIRLLFYLCEG
jgi:hypothetical protein